MSQEIALKSSAEIQMLSQTNAVRDYFRTGNVSGLTTDEKDTVLAKLCERYDLDVILRPFELISFQGKEKFYMTASATNQLAAQKRLTREVTALELDEPRGIAKCVVRVSEPNGRIETGSAYLSISRFVQDKSQPTGVRKVVAEGEDLANALAKLETKAKRRVTLAFFGVPDGDLGDDTGSFASVARPEVLADAGKAAAIAEASAPAAARDAEVLPATETKKPGRPKKATAAELTPEESAKVAEAVAAAQAQAPTPQMAKALEQEIATVATAQVTAQVAPSLVTYARAAHAQVLVAAADAVFGGAEWRTDAAKKELVKGAIAKLDGQVGCCVEGSQVPAPSFVLALKGAMGL
jgi:hypothetical protein